MSNKCAQCRKNPIQDSRWDKVRLWFFHWFHADIIDLSQDKYTQGFGDGYKTGRDHQRDSQKQLDQVMNLAMDAQELRQMPPIVDLEKVLTSNPSGQLFLNGVAIDKKKLEQLKGEVVMFSNSLLWDVVTNTLIHQAQKVMFNSSETLQDFMNGKTICYTIGVQQKILQKIDRAGKS